MAMNFCLHGSARTIKEAVARAKKAEISVSKRSFSPTAI